MIPVKAIAGEFGRCVHRAISMRWTAAGFATFKLAWSRNPGEPKTLRAARKPRVTCSLGSNAAPIGLNTIHPPQVRIQVRAQGVPGRQRRS
jgi:hypothetical protein